LNLQQELLHHSLGSTVINCGEWKYIPACNIINIDKPVIVIPRHSPLSNINMDKLVISFYYVLLAYEIPPIIQLIENYNNLNIKFKFIDIIA